jgi:hypothetical protein
MSLIKKTNDLILGICSLIISLWLVLDSSLIKGFALVSSTPFLARPDVYVRIIAAVWAILALLLVLKSLNLTGQVTERVKFSFNLPLVTLLPMVAFIFCILILEDVGFFISSFVLMTVMCFVFQLKEKHLTLRADKEVFKILGISCGFSVVLVFSLEQIFTHLLKVTLP